MASMEAMDRIQLSKELIARLEDLYGDMPPDFLWDTSKFQTLIHPTLCPEDDSEHDSNEYTYVGRAGAQALYKRLIALGRGRTLQIRGAKGSGKSTVVSSIAGYMLGKEKARVVYICADRFVSDPTEVLQLALLVATRGDPFLASLTTFDELIQWCKSNGRMTLLFVVDDWETVERFPEAETKLLAAVSVYHILVKLSSTNSMEGRISDKPPPTFDFDGPYNRQELATWIAQSHLPESKLENLDTMTGGMPRLLRIYERVRGNRIAYMREVDGAYVKKMEEMVLRQTTPEELGSILTLVLTGVPGVHIKHPIDYTCFYLDRQKKLRFLSPYLRFKAESCIMERQQNMDRWLDHMEMLRWNEAVKADCTLDGKNPRRLGWNVEALLIAIMRYQKKLWGDLDFRHYRTFQRGGEAQLLGSLTEEELEAGVLAGPVALNQRGLDIVYLRLQQGVLVIKAVHITVSQWKDKRRKKSQVVWQRAVLPKWLAENWTVNHQFVYVMPEKVRLNDLVTDSIDYMSASPGAGSSSCGASTLTMPTGGARGPRRWRACRSESPMADRRRGEAQEEESSSDEDEEADVGVEDDSQPAARLMDFSKVKSEGVLFKRLGDIHKCLSAFDKLLDLRSPNKLTSQAGFIRIF